MLDTRHVGPVEAVRCFRDCLLQSDVSRAGEFFSFASAHEYMSDIAASLGQRIPEETVLRREIEGLFSSAEVHATLASYSLEEVSEKIMGPVASVVFRKAGAAGGIGVASLVMEDRRWKVRTYPGVFPGRLCQ